MKRVDQNDIPTIILSMNRHRQPVLPDREVTFLEKVKDTDLSYDVVHNLIVSRTGTTNVNRHPKEDSNKHLQSSFNTI